MTYIRAGEGLRAQQRAAVPSLNPVPLPIGLDRHHIQATIAAKRAQIASLEIEWTAASEHAAARSLGADGHLGDRQTWDRATWDRYLNAASECQDNYLPGLRRLYAEVDRLERLQTPLAAGKRAA